MKFMFTYQKRSQALKIANSLRKQGWKFGDAQRRAWQVVRFMEAVRQGEVVLRFTKKGDDIPQQRIATAITSGNYKPKGIVKKKNPLQVVYFDHNRQAVRSFNAARFVGFKAAA